MGALRKKTPEASQIPRQCLLSTQKTWSPLHDGNKTNSANKHQPPPTPPPHVFPKSLLQPATRFSLDELTTVLQSPEDSAASRQNVSTAISVSPVGQLATTTAAASDALHGSARQPSIHLRVVARVSWQGRKCAGGFSEAGLWKTFCRACSRTTTIHIEFRKHILILIHRPHPPTQKTRPWFS